MSFATRAAVGAFVGALLVSGCTSILGVTDIKGGDGGPGDATTGTTTGATSATTSGTTTGATSATTTGTTTGSTSATTGGTTTGSTSATTSGTTTASTSATTGGTTTGATSATTGGTTTGSTSATTGGTTTGSTSATTGGTTTGATSATSTGTTTGTAPLPPCAPNLQDKVTACTASSPTCNQGCGPELSGGASTLGEKTCDCDLSTLVYNCEDCVYESPVPKCYTTPATPPACATGTANGATCTTVCSGTASGVCTLTTDAGKVDGCVCIMDNRTPVWTCATQWW